MIKLVHLMLALVLAATAAHAEQLLAPVSLDAAAPAASGGTGEGVRITGDPAKPVQRLAELPAPGITSPVYAIKGEIRYDDVEGEGYLQLDSHFAGKGSFFSRTLATAGPMGTISGTSGWRAFSLPFYANQGDQAAGGSLRPDRLTLSVYLPGSGSLFMRNVALYQYASGEDPLGAGGPSFDGRMAIWFAAMGGSALGCWGALIGILASRGKARGFVIGSANVLVALGVVCLVLGAAAWTLGQPSVMYQPLSVLGVLLIAVVGMLRRTLPKRYELLELKKMRAMDG